MVSRRKILSRSRDDLNADQPFVVQQLEEDVWYQKDKLFKEHIQEVLDKWEQIDDEIWAKVIVFERNRRVAKAYARTPVLTVNGAEDGFDGMRIGLNGFENPMRDVKTADFKRQIGQGVKLKMDDAGNILVRRYARSNVYVKATATAAAGTGAAAGNTGTGGKGGDAENSISADILKLPGQALEADKVLKLFDMKKFQSNINRELRQAYPDRRRLELQCLSAVAFVRSEPEVLDCPVWVLIVNVVAMDLLKSKLPPIIIQRASNVKSRPRLPIPDEDPYSIAGQTRVHLHDLPSDSSGYGGSSNHHQQQKLIQQLQQQHQHQQHHDDMGHAGHQHGSGESSTSEMREQLYQMGAVAKNTAEHSSSASLSAKLPPQLPPRDGGHYGTHQQNLPTPDYDEEVKVKPFFRGPSKTDKNRKKYVTEDPYYCGLSARVPKFDAAGKATTTKPAAVKKQSVSAAPAAVPKRMSVAYLQPMNYNYQLYASHQQLQMMPGNGRAYQQNLNPTHQHHHQQQHLQQKQMMWHARSMESGLDYTEYVGKNPYGFDAALPIMHRPSNRRPV